MKEKEPFTEKKLVLTCICRKSESSLLKSFKSLTLNKFTERWQYC